MKSFRVENLFGLVMLTMSVLSVLAFAGLDAGGVCDFCNACDVDRTLCEHTPGPILSDQFTQASSGDLAFIGAELLKPPSVTDPADYSFASGTSALKSLPAAPAALFMALLGFLCISLVRDRKVWFAACVGLLYVGQLGFVSLPKLATGVQNYYKSNHTKVKASAAVGQLDNHFCVQSEVDDTKYIGLLHKLSGIPDSFKVTSVSSTRMITDSVRDIVDSARQDLSGEISFFPAHTTYFPQFSNDTNRVVRLTSRHFCFSPALVLSNLPNGPPA